MNGKPTRFSWGRRAAQWAALWAIVVGAATAGWNGYWYTVGRMAVKRDAPQPSPPPTAPPPTERSTQKDAPLGARLGELAIPKLGAVIPVYEGVREQELRRGVGHYPASDWPGEKGHVVLSGHRDTVFRRFGELKIGDALVIRTDRAAIHYRIVNIRIVDDDDRTVLVDKARPTLTVTTCYPFRLIGRAPKRCIVTARPVRVEALAFPRG
ncbi:MULTISPECIES: class D sortase [Geobacillus]|uniref:Class D sortase n=1 Tax=Geobacillus thermocatenulatus TaxID=33938 RepID=A0A226QB98_9BACL|nr:MULTISPECIES: class D sortase [Geobacillus]ASS98107.1 class D sortase [Geobacillus thermocatenulatus]KLR74435.1 sortase [Geobacillus sp. T6]OXB88850.1 class D sortase [Geobacillus thermocatenulatus]RAN22230.1 sortase [Geobacillus sp. A8]